MSFKIDTQMIDHLHDSKLDDLDIAETKKILLEALNDFPYDNVNLEKDDYLASLIYSLKNELKINLDCTLISKASLIEELTQKESRPKGYLNPAKDVCSYFDLVSRKQNEKKQKHYDDLSSINKDLESLGRALSVFQTASITDECDFSKDKEKQIILDQIKQKFGLPPETSPYVWSNKNEVTAFLNQKIKELTHRSSEVMLHLQHDADQLKSMVDITKNILDDDAKLKDYIIRKSQS